MAARRVVTSAVHAAGGDAGANGRNPQTIGIYSRNGDTQSLYVATTFGLGHDDGCTFNWLCEQSDLGTVDPLDPTYASRPMVRELDAMDVQGLQVSRDGGCTFTSGSSTAKRVG